MKERQLRNREEQAPPSSHGVTVEHGAEPPIEPPRALGERIAPQARVAPSRPRPCIYVHFHPCLWVSICFYLGDGDG